MALDDATFSMMQKLDRTKKFVDDPEWTTERALALLDEIERIRRPAPDDQHPAEPSSEECHKGERLSDFQNRPAFAGWYPQMGGYVGRCVIVLESEEPDGCFDVYVWHDGCFPFHGEGPHGGKPSQLHHCMPSQFVGLGQIVQDHQNRIAGRDRLAMPCSSCGGTGIAAQSQGG